MAVVLGSSCPYEAGAKHTADWDFEKSNELVIAEVFRRTAAGYAWHCKTMNGIEDGAGLLLQSVHDCTHLGRFGRIAQHDSIDMNTARTTSEKE